MQAEHIATTNGDFGPFVSNKTLGTIGMLASPMFLIESLIFGVERTEGMILPSLMNLFFLAGWVCSSVALVRLRATGGTGVSRAIFGLQAAGFVLAGSQEVQNLIYGAAQNTPFYTIADIAWPSSVTFMLVVGAFAIAAKRLKGWRKFAPLLCGLTVPIGVLATVIMGQFGMRVFGFLWFTFAWMILGYAVRASGEEQRSV